MSVKAFRITPDDLAIDQVNIDGSRESILALIDAAEMELRPLAEDSLLIGNPHAFSQVVKGDHGWNFLGSESITAGAALIVGLNEDGSFKDAPFEISELMHAVRFIQLAGMEQVTVGTQLLPDHGLCQVYAIKLVPELVGDSTGEMPVMTIEAPTPKEEEKAPVGTLAWTVYKDPDGYTAVGYFMGGPRDGEKMKMENETYEGLRAILPTGLTSIPRSDTDAADIVETLV